MIGLGQESQEPYTTFELLAFVGFKSQEIKHRGWRFGGQVSEHFGYTESDIQVEISRRQWIYRSRTQEKDQN